MRTPCPVCGHPAWPEILAVTLAGSPWHGAKSIAEVRGSCRSPTARSPERAHAGSAGKRSPGGAQGDPAAARLCSTSGWSTCRCPGGGHAVRGEHNVSGWPPDRLRPGGVPTCSTSRPSAAPARQINVLSKPSPGYGIWGKYFDRRRAMTRTPSSMRTGSSTSGPGAGEHGGRIVHSGPYDELLRNKLT